MTKSEKEVIERAIDKIIFAESQVFLNGHKTKREIIYTVGLLEGLISRDDTEEE